jgi:hypothetical protein
MLTWGKSYDVLKEFIDMTEFRHGGPSTVMKLMKLFAESVRLS